MSKKILLLVTSMFSLLLFFSVVQIDASEVKETLYPNYIENKKLADEIVEQTDFTSTTQEYTSEQFQQIAEDVTKLEVNGVFQISSLEGLQYFTGLTKLEITNLDDSITTIPEQINALVNLENLEISDSNIKTIDNLTNLKNLKVLYLDDNKIEDIKGLDELDSLKRLYLYNNKIEKIKGLDGLGALEDLDLSYNQIKEIKGLDELDSLKYLRLNKNQIKEIKGPDELDLLFELDLEFNQIIDTNGQLNELTEISFLSLKNQDHTEYLTKANEYDEVYKKYNCQDEDPCSFDPNEYRLDNGQYKDKVTDTDLGNDGTYNIKHPDSGYDVDITISSKEEITAESATKEYTEAAGSENELINQLNVKTYDCKGDEDNQKITVYDDGGYDFDNPQVGDYYIKLSFKNVNDYEFYTTVEYTVKKPTISSKSTTVGLSKAPHNDEGILNLLDVKIDGSSELPTEDIKINYGGYNLYNPQADVYKIVVTYKYNEDSTVTTSSSLTVEYDINHTIYSHPATIELSKAPSNDEEIFDLLGVEVDGSSDLPTEGIEINYDGYDFTDLKPGVYKIDVTYNYYEKEFVRTTSNLIVVDDSVPNISSEDKTVALSNAPSTAEKVLELLKVQIEGSSNLPTEGIEISYDEYNISNPQVGVYEIIITYTYNDDKTVTTTSTLTVEDDSVPTISSEDKTVELSNAPSSAEEILELLEVKIDGSSDLPTEGIEINYGGYDFTDPQPGVYEISVTYTYYGNLTVTTTSTLTVEDDSVPTIDVDDNTEVKETGFNYGITAIVALIILVIIILVVKKKKK